MANEIQINHSMSITKGNLRHNQSESVRATLTGTGGPYVGTIDVPTYGLDVSLSSYLSEPGWGTIKNLDSTNYVTWGIRDPDSNRFFEIGELGPGESHPIKLSRNLFTEFVGTGTGTSALNNKLHFRANTATVKVLVQIFPR